MFGFDHKKYRIPLFLYSLIASQLTCGIIYGITSFYPSLRKEHAYDDVCVGDCPAKDSEFNQLATIAFLVINLVSFPSGIIYDYGGPRVAGIVAGGLFGLGALIFSLGPTYATSAVDLYAVGTGLMSSAGNFVFLSSLNFSFLFPPEKIAFVQSFYILTWDTGALNFPLLNLLHEKFGLTIAQTFATLAAIGAIYAISAILVFPSKQFVISSDYSELDEDREGKRISSSEDLKAKELSEMKSLEEGEGKDKSDVEKGDGKISDESSQKEVVPSEDEVGKHSKVAEDAPTEGNNFPLFRKQVFSLDFGMVLLFTTICFFRMSFFAETLEPQFKEVTDLQTAQKFVQIFNVIFGAGGLLSPIGGYVAGATPFSIAFGLVALLGVGSSITNLFMSNLNLQYFTFGMVSFGRETQWATFVYYLVVWSGGQNIGMLQGLTQTLMAIVSIIERPVFTNFGDRLVEINKALCFCAFVACGYPVYLWIQEKKAKKLKDAKQVDDIAAAPESVQTEN